MKVIFSGLVALVFTCFFVSCSNDDSSSPFGDILSQPPYAPLTDSIKKAPKNDELYFRRAVLLNKNNLPEPALADFRKAWMLNKTEKYAFGVTNVLLDKKPDSAIVFLNEALYELPKSYLLMLSLARAYTAQDKTHDALNICNRILQEYPDNLDVLLLQSELYEKKGDTKNSLAAIEKAHSLIPSNWDIAFKLAYKYAEDKNPKTIPLCDSLISKDSMKLYADHYYIKGNYYVNINEKAKAIQWFDQAIKRDYNYLNAYIEKGKVLLDQKKTSEALKVFQLANTISPAFADAWFWIGACYETMGLKEDAKLSYEKAYSLDKTFVEARDAAQSVK